MTAILQIYSSMAAIQQLQPKLVIYADISGITAESLRSQYREILWCIFTFNLFHFGKDWSFQCVLRIIIYLHNANAHNIQKHDAST
jgi:hypothetical protein